MSVVETIVHGYGFFRQRTLGLLERIEAEADPAAVLAWRPGPGRAHMGWQLMHVAVTEEIFAAERLAERPPQFGDLWPRFRGGSTPDDDVPSAAEIRTVLKSARASLLETLSDYDDSRLEEIPPPLAARGLTVRDVLDLIAWHEAHHQGQAHITFNLYQAAHGAA